MRITVQEKEATRARIIEAAAGLFRNRGFEATTTRDIAKTAGIATGTLFNYFAAKEDIVDELARQAVTRAHQAFAELADCDSLEEELFALIAAGLRELKPLRKLVAPLLERSLSPLVAGRTADGEESLRVKILAIAAETIRRHGPDEVSAAALHIFWALYVGVLAFWVTDISPRQEDTLALLDTSMNMFTAWLQRASGGAE